jgi:hypothetical protein
LHTMRCTGTGAILMTKRIRYCVEGCGAHTKKALEDLVPKDLPPEKQFDINDSLVCPWCIENVCGGTTMALQLCGHDNRKDWVKGRKKR